MRKLLALAFSLWAGVAFGQTLGSPSGSSGGGTGTVTSITAGTGITLTPSPITTTGSVAITNTIAAGGPTGSATVTPVITYNAQGQLTTVTTATIAPPFSAVTGTIGVAQLGGSGASHATLVDVAGVPTWKVVPDCTDTGGNHLNYTQSTDAFSCGTSGGAASLTVGSSAIASGTGTRFLYETSGNVLGETAGMTYDATNASVAFVPGTHTTSQPLTYTETWNAAGVTFDAVLVAVTSTASAAASRLYNGTVGGLSVFSVSKAGMVNTSAGMTGPSAANQKIIPNGGNWTWGTQNGAATMGCLCGDGNGNGIKLQATYAYGWPSSTDSTAAFDTQLTRGGAAATIRQGAADAGAPVAQTLKVQNVVAGTADTAGQNWTHIGSLSTGSGASGDIIFQTGGTGAASTVQNTATTALTIKGATQSAIFAAAGVASAPAASLTGAWFSGGSATTTKPQFLVEASGATTTGWSTSGTGFGVNAATGFVGRLLDLQVNGTSVLSVASTGALTTSSSLAATGAVSGSSLSAGAGSPISWVGRGIFSSSAAGTIQFGATDTTTAVAQTTRASSIVAGTADTAGQNWTLRGSLSTGSGVSGDIIIQTGGTGAASTAQNTATTALTIQGATQNIIVASATDSTTTTSGALQVAGGFAVRKRVFIDGIATSAGLQTAVLCQSSGGEMIADSVACLASAARFKNILGPLPDGALTKLMRLKIDRWAYKAEGQFTSDDWQRERIGPIADDVAQMDPRLAGYDSDGKVRTYSTEQLLSWTIKAVQELKADNDNLRIELKQRKSL